MFRYIGLMVGLAASQLVAVEHDTATILPAAGLYVAGEPIDLALTLRNESGAPLGLPGYPRFTNGPNRDGVSLRIAGRAPSAHTGQDAYDKLLAQRGLPQGPAAWWGCCGISQYQLIGAHQTLSVKIYLQQFIGDLDPGDYQVTYSVDIHPTYQTSKTAEGPWEGKGAFRITIVAGTDDMLSAALARHAKPGTDYWSQKENIEGLVLVKSPAVIPFLTQVATGGEKNVILALARFKGNHDAEAFVLKKLRTGDANEILASLAVLQEWRYVLPESETWSLLTLPDSMSAVRVGAILYIAGLPGDVYRYQLRSLLNDPNTSVAKTAASAYKAHETGEQR